MAIVQSTCVGWRHIHFEVQGKYVGFLPCQQRTKVMATQALRENGTHLQYKLFVPHYAVNHILLGAAVGRIAQRVQYFLQLCDRHLV